MDARSVSTEFLHRRSIALARRVTSLEALLESQAAPDTSQSDALEELADAGRSQVERIDAAIARIEAGKYGTCKKCREPIPRHRLYRLPLATECAECRTGLDSDYVIAVNEQHERLRRLLHALAVCLGMLESRACEAAALVLITDLHDELADHFALEEMDGYLGDALEAAPRLAKRAERLQLDHTCFCRRSTDLLAEASRAAFAPGVWVRVEAAFGDLRADLLAHEAAENELVRDALMDDLGPGD